MTQATRDEFLRRLLITVAVVAFAAVSLLLLWGAAEVFLLIFAGLLLAVFFRALSAPLSKYLRLPDMAAVIVVVLALFVVMGLLSWFYAPRLSEEAGVFLERLPEAIGQIEDAIRSTPLGQNLLDMLPAANDAGAAEGVIGQAFSTLFSTLEALLYGFFIFFVGLFLAVQPGLYRRGLVALVPKNRRARVDEVVTASVATLRSWLVGRFISMASVGVMITVGLWLLGTPLAILLGFIAFLLDFVPNIGPFVAAFPAVVLAFGQSPTDALWVMLLYFVVQQIESYLITPIVQQKAVHLPPALTLIAVLLMGLLFGLLGVLVATPLVAVLMIVVKMLYVEDVLGDEVEIKALES